MSWKDLLGKGTRWGMAAAAGSLLLLLGTASLLLLRGVLPESAMSAAVCVSLALSCFCGGRIAARRGDGGTLPRALAVSACVPLGAGDGAVNVLVSFVCAMQVQAFRKVQGHAFASTMCTGNLRSGTEAFWRGVRKRDPAARETARCYFAVIGCFIAGAALGGLLLPRMGRWTALTAVILQLGAFLWMCL